MDGLSFAPRQDAATELSRRIAGRTARIAVVGLGYAGLPLALRFARAGFAVRGLDTDRRRTAILAAGRSPIDSVADEAVAAARLEVSDDPASLRGADILLLCLPTPLDAEGRPDLGPLRAGIGSLAPALRPGVAVALESTVAPGTTRGLLLPILRAAGLTPGEDAFLLYSPEREDPGRPEHGIGHVPKLVAGLTPACLALGRAIYGVVAPEVVPCASPEVAEAAKLHENAFRLVNIALVNELKLQCQALGLDVQAVLDAAATKPFGYMDFRPGPGVGGHCIPVDPHYLAEAARSAGAPAILIEAASRVNAGMPRHVLRRLEAALPRPLAGASVLVMGLGYKSGVADLRESPGLALLDALAAAGACTAWHDPLVVQLPGHAWLDPTPAALASLDAVVLATPQPGMDLGAVARHARLVIDTRGALRQPVPLQNETPGDLDSRASEVYRGATILEA